MDSCFGLVRPHQHATSHKPHFSIACCLHVRSLSPSISYAMLMRPNKAEQLSMAANTWAHYFFFGRFRGNTRYQHGHSALFSGYSLIVYLGTFVQYSDFVTLMSHIPQASPSIILTPCLGQRTPDALIYREKKIMDEN